MNGYWKRKPTEFHGHRRGSRMHCRETRKEEVLFLISEGDFFEVWPKMRASVNFNRG